MLTGVNTHRELPRRHSMSEKAMVANHALAVDHPRVRRLKTSNPVTLPQLEPRIVRVHLVVPQVSGAAVGQLEWSGVWN